MGPTPGSVPTGPTPPGVQNNFGIGGSSTNPIVANALYRPPAGNVTTGVPGQSGGPNIQPPVPPGTGGGNAGISEFGPGNDIRFAQINPQASGALGRANTLGGQGLESLYNAPDRGQIAASQLDLLTQQSEPAFQKALQTVGQRAAALGRLGAGMTTSELGDVTTLRERALAQARQGLAADTAGQTLNDRLNRLNATQGYAGNLYGQEAAARGELRGERGYQTDTANQALQNRINERMMQENLLNSAFGRQATRAQLGLTGSELYGQQANQNIGGAGDLIGSLAFNDQGNPRTPTTSTASSGYSAAPDWAQLDPTLNRLRGARPPTQPVS